MKAKIFSVLVLLLISQAYAQKVNRKSEDIIAQKEIKRGKYRIETNLLEPVVLNMSYGNSNIISEKDRKLIKESEILYIELVYTDFPKGIDLDKLNLDRVNKIKSIRSDLVTNPEIQWLLIRQMYCKNEAEARVLFHGVVVHIRPKQTEEERLAEERRIAGYLPLEKDLKEAKTIRKELQDSTIVKILERKKDWKNITVVADFTGSMSPYASQVVLWFKLHEKEKKIKKIVFFNDGNSTPDRDKVIGSTGGLYLSDCDGYSSIRETALETIKNGNGGDGPENDIEAILYAIKNSPSTNDFILIADNWAPIKDYALMDKITKPIHIILCGTKTGVNLQYMNLALKTKGSIHTMEDDLDDLISKKEGEVFVFEGKTYRIEKGLIREFMPVKRI
jgi:hypothetical protein